jgi:hypothetical protein
MKDKATMANGTIGDDPYTDIVLHNRDVYSPLADALVREIAMLGDERARRGLADRLIGDFNKHLEFDLSGLERLLTEMRDGLKQEARERGYEL